ncbi:hypothetical protein [Cellulophaga fucicola]|uniref:DUF3649 domain-containing protein n=1 Tax=Cellulophaga fucicola TaxID=76595 RepID=A0A1K1MUI7_9FLAO|nr:hypothetical protein [Cellulophaga fucicola]SFW26745.1 hypothetical protein SAMN05660313_00925 [Cellulophaga fucicola]
MPANSKYLTTSPWQHFAKISSGILGGYILASVLHIALALWLPNPKIVLATSMYSIFIVWGVFMIIPFLFKNGWLAWALYLVLIIACSFAIYFGKLNSPLV